MLTSKKKDVKIETPKPFGTPQQLRQHKMLVDSANGHRRKSSTVIDEDEDGKKVRTRATITRHEMECLEELRDRVSDLSFPWSGDDQVGGSFPSHCMVSLSPCLASLSLPGLSLILPSHPPTHAPTSPS